MSNIDLQTIFSDIKNAYLNENDILIEKLFNLSLDKTIACDTYQLKRVRRNIQSVYESFMAEYFEVTLKINKVRSSNMDFIGLNREKIIAKRKDFDRIYIELASSSYIGDLKCYDDFGNEININNYRVKLPKKCNLLIVQDAKNRVYIDINWTKIDYVLKGDEGWLFLKNDRNNSVQKFTGEEILSETQSKDWEKYCSDLNKICNANYIIAPSKERVFPQFYPLAEGDLTISRQIKGIFNNFDSIKFVDPVDLLSKHANSYSKTDTHWTYYGAFLALRAIFGGNFDNRFEFYTSKALGDLGSKQYPFDESDIMYVKQEVVDAPSITNFLLQDGLLSIFINEKACLNKTCVLFGDSYSRYFYPFLRKIYKRVVALRTAGTVIREVIDAERPDVVLIERAERFSINPPGFVNLISDCNLMFRKVPNYVQLESELEVEFEKTRGTIYERYFEKFIKYQKGN